MPAPFLRLHPPPIHLCLTLESLPKMYCLPSRLSVTQKPFEPGWILPVVLKNSVFALTPCHVKYFCPCLTSTTFPSSWKIDLIQPVTQKGDRSQPSNYALLLLFLVYQKFSNLLSSVKLKSTLHLTTLFLIVSMASTVHQRCSAGDLQTLLSDSWSSSLLLFYQIHQKLLQKSGTKH